MRRKIFAISLMGMVFVVFTMFSLSAYAEETTGGTASNYGIYGGNTWDIAVDGNYVYTVADGTPNGFFYSTDSGATWSQPAGNNDFGSGQSVEIDSLTGDVYVGLGGDLYKSTDHGATLTLIKENAGNPLVFGSNTVLGAFNNVLEISGDNGSTFSSVTVSDVNSITSLAASLTAGTFYLVGTDESSNSVLLSSTDYGATWNTVANSETGYSTVRTNPYNANYLVIADDHHTFLSIDAGATFTYISNAPASCNTIATWTSTGRLYACSSFSDDNGATWTQMNFDSIVRGPGKIIIVDPADENILYADSMSGVTKSTDAGVTWANSYEGITGVNVLDISTTADKTVAWTSSSNGLAKSADFNSENPTWEFPILPCAPERCDPSGIGDSVWVKPDDANIVLAGSIGAYIFYSTDAGENWVLADLPASVDEAEKFIDQNSGMSSLRTYQFINDPNDSAIVYAALSGPTIGAVIKSTDSGATWEDLALTDDAPARTLAVNSSGVLYVGTGFTDSTLKGIYKYESSSWEILSGFPTDVDTSSIAIDPDDENTIYATTTGDAVAGADGFYKSTDAGQTWEEAAGLGDYYNFNAVTIQSSTNPNTLYISCRDSEWHGILLKSNDSGATWGVLYTGLKSETFNTLVFDGLLAGSDRGLLGIKTNAKITLKVNNRKKNNISVAKNDMVTIKTRLSDAATGKYLKSKKIKIYRKRGTKNWKFYKTVKTNKNGLATFQYIVKKSTKMKAIWTPGANFSEEYIAGFSRIISFKIR